MTVVYKLEIATRAQHDLAKLDRTVLKIIQARLQRLAEKADEITHLPLTGQYAGLYKLRVHGKYRIIYDLQKNRQAIIVVRVGKRSDIYRD